MSVDPLAGLLGSVAPARRAALVSRPVPAGTHAATRPQGRTTHAFPDSGGPRYIVGMEGARSMEPVVVIREVKPGSCAYTLSKREAWEAAQRRARPVKSTGSAFRQYAARIDAINLNGDRTVAKEVES